MSISTQRMSRASMRHAVSQMALLLSPGSARRRRFSLEREMVRKHKPVTDTRVRAGNRLTRTLPNQKSQSHRQGWPNIGKNSLGEP